MFTGLVEETGDVVSATRGARSTTLTIASAQVYIGAQLGDSIAVNGCCLTVVDIDGNRLTFDAVPETLARTNIGELVPGDCVNLERPLQIGQRLGGHFVQGHVDGIGVVHKVEADDNASVVTVEAPMGFGRYFIEKGSITMDGVSLTVAATRADVFTVWIVPHTREVTTLGSIQPDDRVNLECDMLGKYVEKLLEDRLAIPGSHLPQRALPDRSTRSVSASRPGD